MVFKLEKNKETGEFHDSQEEEQIFLRDFSDGRLDASGKAEVSGSHGEQQKAGTPGRQPVRCEEEGREKDTVWGFSMSLSKFSSPSYSILTEVHARAKI